MLKIIQVRALECLGIIIFLHLRRYCSIPLANQSPKRMFYQCTHCPCGVLPWHTSARAMHTQRSISPHSTRVWLRSLTFSSIKSQLLSSNYTIKPSQTDIHFLPLLSIPAPKFKTQESIYPFYLHFDKQNGSPRVFMEWEDWWWCDGLELFAAHSVHGGGWWRRWWWRLWLCSSCINWESKWIRRK